MSTYNNAGVSPITFQSEDAIAINTFVKQGTGNWGVAQATAEGDLIVGVALNSASGAGESVAVQIFGIAQVVCNGTAAIGRVEATTGGKATTAGGAASNSGGLALVAGGADGSLIPVLLHGPRGQGPASS